MPWFDACAPDDVPADRGWPVVVGGRQVAVFRDGDAFRALDNVCLHVGSPIDDGHVEDGCVTCPWHGWRYDLASGELLTLLGRHPGLRSYPVRVEGGRLSVAVG